MHAHFQNFQESKHLLVLFFYDRMNNNTEMSADEPKVPQLSDTEVQEMWELLRKRKQNWNALFNKAKSSTTKQPSLKKTPKEPVKMDIVSEV